jgi:hypothetical protein
VLRVETNWWGYEVYVQPSNTAIMASSLSLALSLSSLCVVGRRVFIYQPVEVWKEVANFNCANSFFSLRDTDTVLKNPIPNKKLNLLNGQEPIEEH